jgi:hypothetical protein
MNSEQSHATAFRWIARIAGVLLTILTLVIGIGEALDGARSSVRGGQDVLGNHEENRPFGIP